MKKELKDYLHLYLGCECMAGSQKGILESVNCVADSCDLGYDIDDEESGFFGEYTSEQFKLYQVKPILRPLNDMTENEKVEVELNVVQYCCHSEDKYVMWTFEQTRILLCKHFDLYGLIESGLAIKAESISVSS